MCSVSCSPGRALSCRVQGLPPAAWFRLRLPSPDSKPADIRAAPAASFCLFSSLPSCSSVHPFHRSPASAAWAEACAPRHCLASIVCSQLQWVAPAGPWGRLSTPFLLEALGGRAGLGTGLRTRLCTSCSPNERALVSHWARAQSGALQTASLRSRRPVHVKPLPGGTFNVSLLGEKLRVLLSSPSYPNPWVVTTGWCGQTCSSIRLWLYATGQGSAGPSQGRDLSAHSIESTAWALSCSSSPDGFRTRIRARLHRSRGCLLPMLALPRALHLSQSPNKVAGRRVLL